MQSTDPYNAFSESSTALPNSAAWASLATTGDLPNTIRGDRGLNINGGRQSGNVTITGGTSRNASDAGSVLISSGGQGSSSLFYGSSGSVEISTAPGGINPPSGASYASNSGERRDVRLLLFLVVPILVSDRCCISPRVHRPLYR